MNRFYLCRVWGGGGWVWGKYRQWVSWQQEAANALYTHLKTSPQKNHIPPPSNNYYLVMYIRRIFDSISPRWVSSTKYLPHLMDSNPSVNFSIHKQPSPLSTYTSHCITMKRRPLNFNDRMHLIHYARPSQWFSGTVFFRPHLTFLLSLPLNISATRICLSRFDPRF